MSSHMFSWRNKNAFVLIPLLSRAVLGVIGP